MSIISNLRNRLQSKLHCRPNTSRLRQRRRTQVNSIESLETRQLLSATLIGDLSDEFDDASTQSNWQRVNEVEGWNADQLNLYDIDQTQPGRLVMQPHTVVWYADWRGPMAFKEVTGDFVITSEIHISDRDDIGGSDADDVPNDGAFSLGGVMVRTPRDITNPATDWAPGNGADDGTNNGENYVFLSFGYAYSNGASQFGLEVKTTRNSASNLEVTSLGPDANTITVQTARIGNSIITLYQLPGQDWQVHRRYSRPDMPETLQVGMVTYTDWEKANDFDPFLHNGSVLTPETIADPTPGQAFNPDLTAGFEYARFVHPDVPVELQGVDLTSNGISDAQLLSFLGNSANIGPDGNLDLPEVNVVALTERVLESDSETAAFVVSRAGAPLDEALSVSITFDGAAVLDGDYVASASTVVTIPAGLDSTTIFLDPINDSEVERAEDIQLLVLASSEYSTGAQGQATISMRDDDAVMDVGMNLERYVDWTTAWVFKDAFLRARPWGALAINTSTGQQMWQFQAGDGPLLQVDEQGWISELPLWTAEDGTEYQQIAQAVVYTGAAQQPAGIYRAEWDGTGEVRMQYVIETGVTPEGRNYALVDMPEGVHFTVDILSTDPNDPVRNINLWMPDYNGESLIVENWQPGDTTSPFHPLFLERLSGFDTLRFMDWQMTNYNIDVIGWEDRAMLDDVSQGGVLEAPYQGYYDYTVNGVALEYMIELANELGANPWFNMPYEANDEFVENFAIQVRDNLDPELQSYVEWSNELWNAFFPVEGWLDEQAALPENAGLGNFGVASREMLRDFDIWTEVFSGQEDRIIRVVAGQQNNVWVIQQLLAGMQGRFDAISSTAYAGLAGSFASAADETTTADEIIDSLLNLSLPWARERLAEHQAVADWYEQQLGRDILYVTYESGSHVFGFNSGLYGGPAEAAGVEAMYSSRMYDVYQTLLNNARDVGVDLYNEFIFTAEYGASPYGNYGLLYTMDQPLEEAYQYNALVDFINSQQQAPLIPLVTVEATDGSASEAGDEAVFTFTRSGAPLDDALELQFDLAGSAESGVDYVSPGNSIIIPAGQDSVSMAITPIDDEIVEGVETITLQLLDEALYDLGDYPLPVLALADDDFETIGDRSISHSVDVLNIDLPATLPDGIPMTYEASLVMPPLYSLDQQYNFYTNGNFYQNAQGADERWIRGDGNRWFYLLPDGELRRWDGSFTQSTAIALLTPAVYEDPMSLIDVALPEVVISGTQLSINPVDGFIGSFEVDITKSNGTLNQVERITIEVTDTAPVIEPIADQSMPYTQDELRVPLSVLDVDGDAVTTSVRITSDYPWQAALQYSFYSNGNFYQNAKGLNERWIRGDGTRWFFLLPDGELRLWQGSVDNTSLIANLDPAYYDDPMLLINAEPMPVTVEILGDEIVINPAANYAGTFTVEVSASDGSSTTLEAFEVSVVNATPSLVPIPDQSMAIDQTTLDVVLDYSDADGTPLLASVEVIHPAYELDQTYGFWTNGNLYENTYGLQEKWLRGQDNGWYYILASGDMFRWGGSFAASEHIETLDTRYYDDPILLIDAEPLAATAEIAGNILTINRELSLTGLLRLRVNVTDGIDVASLLLTVNIESA